MKSFLDALRGAPLLFDGAMGSLLYERGVFFTRSFDELNLSQPELIAKVHQEYADAGADVLETNTFGANRLALARHGHAEKVAEINRAAVTLARRATGRHDLFVGGAIGPTGIAWDVAPAHDQALARAALEEQIGLLAEAGVDLLLLETFVHIGEMEAAIAAARAASGGLPIIAQMVFGDNARVRGGLAPATVARRLQQAGADVVGANCGAGPPELFEVGTGMLACGAPVALQPNAGLPRVVEGRTIYVANPEHFGVWARRALQAGVRIVGGCCGTTPEHTRRMLGAVRMIGARPLPTRPTPSSGVAVYPRRFEGEPPAPLAVRSLLGAKLAAGTFAVSCELSAPAGTDPSRTLEAARRLRAGGVDIVNIADGPRATARMGNEALCTLLEREAGVETILHVCCRDRSFLGLVAHLLAAHALGQRNLVIITGDPPKMGDYPFSTPVYDERVERIGKAGVRKRPDVHER